MTQRMSLEGTRVKGRRFVRRGRAGLGWVERSLASFAMGLVCTCGPAPPATSPSDVECPEGQRFDGQYCQVVDPTAGESESQTSEPKPAEPEPVQRKPTEGAGANQQDEPRAGEGEDEDDVPVDPANLPPQQATPVDVTMAAQAGPLVQYLAQAHLPPGARPFGQPFAGQFAEGQVLEQKMQLSASQCYTAIGAALPPVTELDLEFYGEDYRTEGLDAEPLVHDETHGSQAVIGSREDCFRPTASGPVWLVVRVTKGQGLAAVQMFAK